MLKALWDFLTVRRTSQSPSPPPQEHVAPPPAPRALPMEPPGKPPVFNDEPLAKKIDPGKAARFWSESLKHLDMAALAKRDKPVAPLERIDDLATVATKGASEITEDGRPAGSDVYVVLLLCSAGRGRGARQEGVLHPLAYVGAWRTEHGLLIPNVDVAPCVNADYLEPGLKDRCFSLGDRDAVERSLDEAFGALAVDQAPGWNSYWNTLLEAVACGLGAPVSELQDRLAHRAAEVAGHPREHSRWRLCAAVYAADTGGTQPLSTLYDSVITVLENCPKTHEWYKQTLLFRQLCKPEPHASTTLPSTAFEALVGHIDEFKDGKRGLFPLDRTQRDAAQAILNLKDGEIQAVNGPPGSGKTSMLRAVVASMWVGAALKQSQTCPIIVACGGTNQSVTNVIGAFGDAPHQGDEPDMLYARRWLPDIFSYGAYYPSASVKGNKEKREELDKYLCLETARNGFLYGYWRRETIGVLNPARVADYRCQYLKFAQQAFPDANIETVADAIKHVWMRLDATHRASKHFHTSLRMRREWLPAAEQYLAQRTGCWTEGRIAEARRRIDALAQDPSQWTLAEEFMDLTWRAECFHWAARYWEGVYLLRQRERLLSRHPNNIEEALRRLCMLTPCLVSTLHMAPMFAFIDEEKDGHAMHRRHALGMIDLLVVDEAGQALPELGAGIFALAKKAAVIGDMKQLAPVPSVTSLGERAIARRLKLECELDAIVTAQRSPATGSILGMARLVSRFNGNDDYGLTLSYHYRCKPSIIRYCDDLCYGDLQPRTREDDGFLEPALGWVEVETPVTRRGGSQCNMGEAEEIVEWIAQRWTVWRDHPNTRGKPIQELVAILTPYAAQASYLEERLKAAFNRRRKTEGIWPSQQDIKKVTIGTVHRLQGAERPIVCFSLVEGPEGSSGSFIDRDSSMLNVAVSRAKQSFIVFGHPQRLFLDSLEGLDRARTPSHRLGRHLRKETVSRRLYPQHLVIIEARGKQRALAEILGKEYLVLPTGGALTSLPVSKDGRSARCPGVDVDGGFLPRSERRHHAAEAVARLRAQADRVESLILATDDDRMGEYIAWQVLRELGPAARDKSLRRARIGAITRRAVDTAVASNVQLDEMKVLAEIVREIVDCLITSHLSVLHGSTLHTGGHEDLVDCGAVTATGTGRARSVGRVQAAILRLLLNKARDVAATATQRRVRVHVEFPDNRFSGYLVDVSDPAAPRATTTLAKARQLAAANARITGPAEVAQSSDPLRAPEAGTAAVMAHAWKRHSMAPWTTMQCLQRLYDGTWSSELGHLDPEEPIAVDDTKHGHPPIVPLDAKASPQAVQDLMSIDDHRVYSLIWSYYVLAGRGALHENAISAMFPVSLAPNLRVCFDARSIEGLDRELEALVLARREMRTPQTVQRLLGTLDIIPDCLLSMDHVPALQWETGADDLLWEMADMQIGRPSTYASALESLAKSGLIDFPESEGVLRLSTDGLATALLLEKHFPSVTDPAYSSELFRTLDKIESGERRPADVLMQLARILMPEANHAEIERRLWNTLPELERRLDAVDGRAMPGRLVSAGDIASSVDPGPGA